MLEAVFSCPYCFTAHPEGTRPNKIYCSDKCRARACSERWKENNKDKDLEQRREQNKRRRETPRGKWLEHKMSAKQRGVDFNLTFEQWWSIWEPHWEGRGVGGLVMCREADRGAYEIGNVRIDTQANNNIEACLTGGRAKC